MRLDPPDLDARIVQRPAQRGFNLGNMLSPHRDRGGGGELDAAPIAPADRPSGVDPLIGIDDPRDHRPSRLVEPRLAAFGQEQTEIDRLRDEQRDRDQQRHLPRQAARQQPPGPAPQSRVTSAASV